MQSQRLDRDGNTIWIALALFPDRAEEQERGYARRPPRVRPRERTCLLFFCEVFEPLRVHTEIGPHLLARRLARSHSWSNVTDPVLESSDQPVTGISGD